MVSVPLTNHLASKDHLDNRYHSNSLHSNSFHVSSNQSLLEEEFSNLNILEYGGSLEDFQRFKHGYNCTSSQLGSMETVDNLHTMDSGDIPKPSKFIWTSTKKRDVPPKPPPPPKPARNSERNSEDGNNYKCFNVEINLAPLEPRFGFSVSGGADESFPARIDNISKGRF